MWRTRQAIPYLFSATGGSRMGLQHPPILLSISCSSKAKQKQKKMCTLSGVGKWQPPLNKILDPPQSKNVRRRSSIHILGCYVATGWLSFKLKVRNTDFPNIDLEVVNKSALMVKTQLFNSGLFCHL